jgi:WD40 repeat protein
MALNFLNSLDADDIFISYSREDGETYLNGLSEALTKLGFSCFDDRQGTDAGPLPPETLFRKIRGCRTLVLLATPGAVGKSKYLAEEVEKFAAANGTTRIVAVSFDEGEAALDDWAGAKWLDLVYGKSRARELREALKTGTPSTAVVSRIEKQSNYLKSKDRLRRYRNRALWVLAWLVVSIVAAAVLAGFMFKRADAATRKANEETSKAERATREAQAALAQAVGAQGQALTSGLVAALSKADADEQKRLAQLASDEATEKTRLADAASRKADAAEQRAAEEQARADREQTVADSRSLANRSQTLLRQRPNELPRIITLAATALKKSHTVEADEALRESLSLLPRYLGGGVYAGDIVAAALSPDATHFAALRRDKLPGGESKASLRVYRVGDAAPFKEVPLEGEQLNDASSIALSDGAAHVAVSSGKSVRVCELKSGGCRTVEIKGESRTVNKIALSPGGKYLALIIEDGETEGGINRAGLMDVEKNEDVKGFSETENVTYNDVAFSANGNLAFGARASGSLGNPAGRVLIWTLSDKLKGDESANKLGVEDFAQHETINQDAVVNAVAPGLDDSYFATDRGIWKRVPLGEFKPAVRLPVMNDEEGFYLSHPIENLAFDADGKQLAAVRGLSLPASATPERVGTDKELERWDATQHPDAVHVFRPGEIRGVGFLPGDRLVAAAPALGGDEIVRVFDAVDGSEPNPETGRMPEGEKVFVSPDARFVATVSGKTAHIRDVWRPSDADVDRSSVADVEFGNDLKEFGALTLSAGGEFLAVAGDAADGDGALALVYARDGKTYRQTGRVRLGKASPQTPVEEGAPAPLAVTPDGRRLLTLTVGAARVWDVESRREVTPAALRELSGVDFIKLGDGGRYLAAVYNDSSADNSDVVLVLRLADGGVAARLSHGKRESSPPFVAFSPRERYLLTSGDDRVTSLFKLDGGGVERLSDDSPVRAAAFSADELYFATGTREGFLKVFVTAEPESEIARLQDTGEATAIAFSRDGRLLATASRRHNPYDLGYEESFPLRVWLLRPGDLTAEADARLATVPPYLREGASAEQGTPGAKASPRRTTNPPPPR